jgi:predicted MFS family arabinose efflux permease
LSAVRLLPYTVLGLVAGVLIDRWDRKRVMFVADLGAALTVAFIPLLIAINWLPFALLALLVFLEGSLGLFHGLASSASLPQVVERERVGDASAWQQVAMSAAFVLGPALYGLLTGLGGISAPFALDAVSFLFGALSVLFIRRSFQQVRVEKQKAIVPAVVEGMQWLWQQRVVRFLAVLVGGLNFCTGGFTLLVLVIAQQLGANDVTVGLLFAAGGVGALVGAFLTGPLQRRFPFATLLTWATWAWTFTWLPFAWTPNIWVLALIMTVGFVIVPIHNTVQYSYRIARIPDELQGRVNSVYRLILFGSQALGAAATGLMLNAFGPVVTVLLLAVPQFALAFATQFNAHIQAER